MIFKQYKSINQGIKTQTRRALKGNESLHHISGVPTVRYVRNGKLYTKYAVGSVYSVQPGRGKPTVMVRTLQNRTDYSCEPAHPYFPTETWMGHYQHHHENWAWAMRMVGWEYLRIKITDIRIEPLLHMTEDDAIAEGMLPVTNERYDVTCYHDGIGGLVVPGAIEAYENLWNSINTKPGLRWQDNPDVIVYQFEAVRE